jgi:hypothetical protein
MERIAQFIIDRRHYVLTFVIIATLFFGYFASKISVKTIYTDLLPQNHPYINVHNEIRNVFGGSNQVLIMVQVKDPEKGGKYKDIFNPDTLGKVKFINDELKKFQGVDRYKILSIAEKKIRNMQLTSKGYVSEPVMWPDVPKTEEQLHKLKLDIYGNPACYPGLVSLDSKSALVMVDFFEEQINYATCFKELQELRKKTEDDNHIIAIAGEPMHLGYIDSYVGDVVKIVSYTVLAMLAVFYFFFRSKRGMLLPIAAAAISAIWGLGFLSLLNFNLDPLVLVFPFLIAAMAASHSTQVIKRYQEEAGKTGDNLIACKKVIQSLFVPGLAGILTDASGIVIIAITPIAILQKITLSCAFWSFITIIVALIFIPVLLAYMPLKAETQKRSLFDRILMLTGGWLNRSGKYVVSAAALALCVWGATYMDKITIGSAVPGSEVLWPFHRYNVDSFRITFSMPLLNPLYIVLDTGKAQGVARAAVTREVANFSRYMKQTPNKKVVMVQTLQGRIPGIHSGMREQDPRWKFLPTDDSQTEFLYRSAMQMGGPGSFDKFVDMGDQNTNIVILCRDKTAQTISEVMGRIHEYIKDKSTIAGTGMKYRLAGGAVGVQAGINETLTEYQLLTLFLSLGIVFLFCVGAFRSFVAGFIMIAPLILSNFLTGAFMVLNNPPLPLTTAILPVSAVGIGLGVDYGIYLASRMIEECKSGKSLSEAVIIAMGTTGKAVIYVATTLIVGIVFWFLSKMMFQALMGLLLAVMLTLNMIGALLVVPSLILLIKPAFIVGRK